jgi:hypothetical protein
MMLVLAVRTDAERVYQRALRYFSEDEIAEAFAAARGIASPSQLRTAMKRDGRDLLAQFRALAPDRQPISLQRWGLKRIVLALGVLAGAAVVLPATADLLTPAHDLQVHGAPMCGRSNLMVLMAQAVPEAEAVPCVASLPAGWDLAGVQVQRGRARFWLDSDVGGDRAVEATLLPAAECQVSEPTEVPSDEMGTRRFERPERLPPGLRSTRTYLFAGGCVTYRFAFDQEATASLMFVADNALAFQPRAELVEEIRDRNGLRLCGAGAPCPGGP